MKWAILLLIFASAFVSAQEKPRVFVQGKGSQNLTSSGSGGGGSHWGTWGGRSTLDSHDEAMEVTKNLQKGCSEVIVTLDQSNADYTVMLNRESKHNRGLLRTNSQVQVANRLGDVLGTNSTHTVGNASKDACQLILADWSQHGRIANAAPASTDRVAPASNTQPPVQEKSSSMTAVQSQPAPAPTMNESAPVGSAPARLRIDSTPPGADIEVDANFVGNTPSDVQVAEGDHSVVIKKAGFKSWERRLKSTAGSDVNISAELEKADN